MERKSQVALDRAAAYRREQQEGGRAATGAAADAAADAADSADGETRGGREGGEDGSEPPDEAEYPDAGYNGMTDPPEPGDDDAAIAEEMLGDLHALDKGLNDNHLAHLHHASYIPTQQQHTTHIKDEETYVDLPQTQA